MPGISPNREQVLSEWRRRVRNAAEAWNLADEEYKRTSEHAGRPNNLALERARQAKDAAAAEYMHVLNVFTALVLHGRFPDGESI